MADRHPGIRPRVTFGRRLDMAARFAFPATTTALLLILTAAPLGLPAEAEVQTALALGCVFFWSVFRPLSMPPPLVFLLGLLVDLLQGAPPGIGVIAMLAVHGLGTRWRRHVSRQGFVRVWLIFVAVACAAAALQWALNSALAFAPMPAGPALFLAAISAGIYPALAVLLTWAHQTLADPDHG